jgi:hypothetical protein
MQGKWDRAISLSLVRFSRRLLSQTVSRASRLGRPAALLFRSASVRKASAVIEPKERSMRGMTCDHVGDRLAQRIPG